MGNRFRDWANAGSDDSVDLTSRLRRSAPVVQAEPVPPPSPVFRPQEPQPQAQQLIDPRGFAAGSRSIVGMSQPRPDGRMQGVFTTPVLETCYIVKAGGHDSYKELMAQLPDLTNGQDFSDGVDAMALPGIPEFAEMRDWTDGARYYTGATDRRAKESLGDVIQRRYGDNVGNIRQSRASRIASTGSPPNRNR